MGGIGSPGMGFPRLQLPGMIPSPFDQALPSPAMLGSPHMDPPGLGSGMIPLPPGRGAGGRGAPGLPGGPRFF